MIRMISVTQLPVPSRKEKWTVVVLSCIDEDGLEQ